MSGLICLQGGNEFNPQCREIDQAWLDRVGPGPTVVLPLACAAGAEYRTAGRNGREYLRAMGLDDVTVAPEPDLSLDRTVHTIVDAAVVVLPGGSPGRIRRRVVGTAMGGALRAHLNGGGTVVGASAGAMVLASMMMVPDSDKRVQSGLGVVPDLLVLPHYTDSRRAMIEQLRSGAGPHVTIVGVPTCAEVIVDGDVLVAVGAEPCWRFTPDGGAEQIPTA